MTRVFERLWRFLFGDDIFVSYSRADGATYAAGLANELTGCGFSCKLDQWGSQPGKEIPAPLRAALRRSSMLVLVASPAAAASEQVAKEILEFHRTRRAIVPIDIGGGLRSAPFWPQLEGLHISHDELAALQSGEPDRSIVNRIEKTHTFTRKDRRLRSAAAATTTILAVLVVAAVIAAVIASREAAKAVDQQRLARSRQLLAEAELIRNRGQDPFAGSMAKALEAWGTYESGEVDGILRYGLDRLPRLIGDFEHPAPVVDLKLHRDGSALTTLCEDGQARVWRAGETQPVASLGYKGSQHTFLAADGRTLAVVRQQTAHIYRFAGNAFAEIGRVEHAAPIEHVVFNADATRLATAGGAKPVITIVELTAPTLTTTAVIEPTVDGRMHAIKMSADGSHIAVGTSYDDDDDDDTHYPVVVWEVNPLREILKTGGDVFELNADGSMIATSLSDTWWVHQVSFGTESTQIARVVEEGSVTSFAFVDKLLITASQEWRVRLYDLENDAKELLGFDHDAPVGRVWMQAVEDFDNLVTLSGEKTVHRWQARQVGGDPQVYEALRIAHAAPVTAVSVQGRVIATASNDRHARIWAKSAFGSDSGFDHAAARSYRFTADGRYVAIVSGSGLTVWDFASSRRVGLPTDLFTDRAALLPGAARVVTWGYGATPQILDLTTKTVIANLGKKGGVVHAASDGEHFAVRSDTSQGTVWRGQEKLRTVDCPAPIAGLHLSGRGRYLAALLVKHPAVLFDVRTGAERARLDTIEPPDDGNVGGSQTLAFSPDERYLAVKDDTKVVLLETANGRRVRELAHAEKIWSVAFSADGSRLLVRHDANYTLWEVTGSHIASVQAASAAALSDSGKHLFVARENGSAELIDATTASVLWSVPRGSATRYIAFAGADQPYLATAENANVRVRDLRNGSVLTSMDFDREVKAIRFTPDGQALLVIREDGTDRIPIDVRALVGEARARLDALKRVGVRF